MKGGVILFRGTGGAARRYLESDRSTADEYYLGAGTALAEFAVLNRDGNVTAQGAFTPEQYADWVDWRNPFTGATRGTPRLPSHAEETTPGERRHVGSRLGSPRFAEVVINAPKSLSIAAALHPDVSEVLDRAEADAVAEIGSWLAQHSVTRVGPRGLQEIVGVDQLETVTVVHKTSRAGDPHRHVHFQIGTRVFAAGKWRGLDTAALFKQQGAIRALGTAVIAAHPELTRVLAEHGLTLDHATGEVAELERYNAVLSKRAAQVGHNLAALVAAWEDSHPGEEPGPVVRARMLARAWDHQRPHKVPTAEGLGCEEGWRRELQAAGYRPTPPAHRPLVVAVVPGADDLSVERLAARALDRCAAAASTWTIHDIQMHVTRLITEHGITATGPELRDLITVTTRLAAHDCLSVLPPEMARPDQVAHLTTVGVIAAEGRLRDLIGARAAPSGPTVAAADRIAAEQGMDTDQAGAAAAIASAAPLVVIEGAAGAGKTTMLGAAIDAAAADGRVVRVVTPTKKSADVAAQELGVTADSVAALVHANGWRWNDDGVWTRLHAGQPDPDTGVVYTGPAEHARLRPGERIVVDEAGMLDQDSASALFTLAAEAGAAMALVGDRAQLPAVGRGGVLDIAADLATASGMRIHDLTDVHRFTDPEYAALTLDIRTRKNPEQLFDRLQQRGLVRLHESNDAMHSALADLARVGDAVTVATNEQARELNAAIRQARATRGEIAADFETGVVGSDGLSIGPGDLVVTRRNDNTLGVANRQTWTVQHADDRGLWVILGHGAGRRTSRHLPTAYVDEHVHLAYASTAYGVQGATTDVAHTVLTGPRAGGFDASGLDAAGLYVGLTRGRRANTIHIVADDLEEAQELFVYAMERDRADRGLVHATTAAREATTGLIPAPAVDSDAEFVVAERSRLVAHIERARTEIAHWERALAKLEVLDREHAQIRAPYEEAKAVAREREATIRAAVSAQALEQTLATVEAVREAESTMQAASDVARHSGWIKRQAAYRALAEARSNVDTLISEAAARWGSAPVLGSDRIRWAERTTDRATSEHPDVVQAHSETGVAARELARIDASQLPERTALRQSLLGRGRRADALRRTSLLQKRIGQVVQVIDTIDTMPSADAATYLRRTTQRPARSGGAVGPAMLEPKRSLAPAPEVLGDKPRTSPTLRL